MEQTDKKQSTRVQSGRTLTQWMAYALWAAEIIPADAGFFAVASECEIDGEERFNNSSEYEEWDKKYNERSARYSGDHSPDWEAGAFVPDEIKALDVEMRRLRDSYVVAIMKERGQSDMADLYMNNRVEFDRRCDAGRAYFFDEDYEEWKAKKIDGVTLSAEELVSVLDQRTSEGIGK